MKRRVIKDVQAVEEDQLLREYRRMLLAKGDQRDPEYEWALKKRIVHDFGRLNGWVTGDDQEAFSVHHLANTKGRYDRFTNQRHDRNIFDHQLLYFREDFPSLPAAIVGQPYGHSTFYEEVGLYHLHGHVCAHTPPAELASIHSPGECRFFVFTPPGVTVAWLPEQMLENGPFRSRGCWL